MNGNKDGVQRRGLVSTAFEVGYFIALPVVLKRGFSKC